MHKKTIAVLLLCILIAGMALFTVPAAAAADTQPQTVSFNISDHSYTIGGTTGYNAILSTGKTQELSAGLTSVDAILAENTDTVAYLSDSKLFLIGYHGGGIDISYTMSPSVVMTTVLLSGENVIDVSSSASAKPFQNNSKQFLITGLYARFGADGTSPSFGAQSYYPIVISDAPGQSGTLDINIHPDLSGDTTNAYYLCGIYARKLTVNTNDAGKDRAGVKVSVSGTPGCTSSNYRSRFCGVGHAASRSPETPRWTLT